MRHPHRPDGIAPWAAVLLPLFVLTWVLGCATKVEPAGTLSSELASAELAYPQWQKLHLKATPGRAVEAEDLYVFVHLKDSGGVLVRTFDTPLDGSWTPGETLEVDVPLYQSALAPPLAPGSYDLIVGIYSPTGERLPLALESTVGGAPAPNAAALGSREYRVATLEVPPVGAEAPAFAFDTAWADAEPGADQQILGRRWLTGEGTVEIANLEVPGSLWLRLQIPTTDPEVARMVPNEEGAPETAVPRLEISSTCTDQIWTFTGAGIHEKILPVHGAGDTATCEVTVSPDYVILFLESLERRSAVLDLLALTPAEL